MDSKPVWSLVCSQSSHGSLAVKRMMNFKGAHLIFTLLLIISFPRNSSCGICDLCVCTQTEISRIVNCVGKHEIGNYTEIFDLLAFDDYNDVEKLIITKHEIVTLPLDAFRGLKLLKSLDLSENSIVDIEADVFKDLTNLEELNFSFNQLSALTGAVFDNVQSLLKLNLSNNEITDLNEITADQLPKLTHLDLSHNNLQTIDSTFIRSLRNLEFLDVSFNAIGSLSGETMPKLRSLLELRANNNHLERISGEYLTESLKVLSVGHNAITSMPENLFQIRELNIEDNRISSIEADAAWMRHLERLNVSGNALTDFPDAKLNNLTILDISRNQLKAVPQTIKFDNLPMLGELVIGGNPIKDLTFKSELRLRTLIVRGLELLETIEIDAFRNLKGVDDGCINITVSENRRLSLIEKGTFDGIAICFLDLSKNAFTQINLDVIKSANKFVAQNGIDLQMNPFNCDCESQWMLNDLVPHLYTVNSELLEDLRCSTPAQLSGTRMVHWFKWKKQVFCDTSAEVLSKMTVDAAAILIGDGKGTTVRLESSRGMLAVVAGAMGTLCILIIVGILVARKIAIRRRQRNRRF